MYDRISTGQKRIELSHLRQPTRRSTEQPLRRRLRMLLACVCRFYWAGLTAPANFQRPAIWFDLRLAVKQLRPWEDYLPAGFIRRTVLAFGEVQERLLEDPTDPYSLNQLRYLARTVCRAIQEVC